MTVTDEEVIERIRAAGEELTGLAAAESERHVTEASGGRGALWFASAACILGLVAVLGWVGTRPADTAPSDTPRSVPTGVVTADAAGMWWDLDSAPPGFDRRVDEDLASTSVCVGWVELDGAVECTQLEGVIAADYFDTAVPAGGGDETQRAWSIRTVFGADADRYVPTGADVTSVSVELRGTSGNAITTSEESMVVWPVDPFRHVVVSSPVLTVEELVRIADGLLERSWPTTVTLPIAAIPLGPPWSAGGNNHPYLLAAHDAAGRECVGIGFRPNLDFASPGVCAERAQPTWTVGTIGTETKGSDFDVIAGLAPPGVTQVSLHLDNGENWFVETVSVPGFDQRAWAISLDLPQGTPIIGTLTAADNADATWTVDIVAAAPTVWVDTVCELGDGVIPDVAGENVIDALAQFRSHGVVIANPVRASPSATVDSVTPPAGTSVGCGDVIVTLDQPEVVSDPDEVVPVPPNTTTAPPESTDRPTTDPTLPADPVDYLAIGDSVMLGAASELAARGYTVNATVGRFMTDVIPLMQQLSDANLIGDAVIVHLGNNGPITAETLDAFLTPLAGADNILILNVHVDRPWAAENNRILAERDQPDGKDNIILIDWNSIVESCPVDCIAADGVHLTEQGKNFYADAIGDYTGR